MNVNRCAKYESAGGTCAWIISRIGGPGPVPIDRLRASRDHFGIPSLLKKKIMATFTLARTSIDTSFIYSRTRTNRVSDIPAAGDRGLPRFGSVIPYRMFPPAKRTHRAAIRFGFAFLLTASMCSASAHAAGSGPAYPDKPIRLIVPQPPGGAGDIVARLLAPNLHEKLGQPVIVDNRPGANGILGTEIAANAAPDGYTLALLSTGMFVINPVLYQRLPYRPMEDFATVSITLATPFLMVVHPSLRVSTVAELVALAKKRTDPLNYSSPGTGSLHHLSMEWFGSATGTRLIHIPYKGALAFNAVISGEVSLTFGSVVGMQPHAKAGRVIAIAISSKDRSDLFPGLPTVSEAGVRGFEARNWFGLVAPRGTPPQVVSRLSATIAAHLKSAEMKGRLLKLGADPVGSTPEEFARFARAELKRWGEVVRISGTKVN